MAGKVKVIYAEKIPENAEAARVMEKMIAQGTKIIFLTAYGYLDPGLKVAAHHPDVIFMQVNRQIDRSLPNVGAYYSFFYEPLYAAGVVAGRMTKTNNIGFVVSRPVPPCLGSLNAFVLGAHSVNPKVRTKVVYTDSWDDPPVEAEATRGLIENGADIIVSAVDNPLTICRTAADAGVYCIGSQYDLSNQISKHWLVGQCHNWGPLYVKLVQSVMDGSWKPGINYYHLKDGYTKLTDFGSPVPQNIRAEALRILQRMKSDKLIVFQGPIKDREGKLRIPPGRTIDDQSLTSMNWIVSDVEGRLGK